MIAPAHQLSGFRDLALMLWGLAFWWMVFKY